MVVDLGAAAVRRGDGDDVAFGIVEIAGFASERVAFYGNVAVAVAFAVAALSVGVDAVGETAQFFAVASVNGGQIAVAVVVVAIWQRSSEKCLHCAYLTLGMEILYKIRITNF